MAANCPKCAFANTADSEFCKKCGTQLIPAEGLRVSETLTLETPAAGLTRGALFAGRYEILEELGGGGMGRVYRVYDRKLEEEAALKLIRPDIAANREAVERFKNELKVTRKIRNANACGMFDLQEEGQALFITMEYVRGEDLQSVIHQMGTLTMGKAISIAHQVAEGLAEAHKLGLIHQDLKPGNIMIDKDGNAKIMSKFPPDARAHHSQAPDNDLPRNFRQIEPEQGVVARLAFEKIQRRPVSLLQAIVLVQRIMPYLHDIPGRAQAMKGRRDLAVSFYERFVSSNPRDREMEILHPFSRLELAKLYESSGEWGKALAQLERLAELWKNADQGLAQVEEARQRLAALRGSKD